MSKPVAPWKTRECHDGDHESCIGEHESPNGNWLCPCDCHSNKEDIMSSLRRVEGISPVCRDGNHLTCVIDGWENCKCECHSKKEDMMSMKKREATLVFCQAGNHTRCEKEHRDYHQKTIFICDCDCHKLQPTEEELKKERIEKHLTELRALLLNSECNGEHPHQTLFHEIIAILEEMNS